MFLINYILFDWAISAKSNELSIGFALELWPLSAQATDWIKKTGPQYLHITKIWVCDKLSAISALKVPFKQPVHWTQ